MALWLLPQVASGAMEGWCSRLRELLVLPPSSGRNDAWILSRLLIFIMRL